MIILGERQRGKEAVWKRRGTLKEERLEWLENCLMGCMCSRR